MRWAHRGEMTVIEGGEPGLAEALDDREHGAVDEANTQVGVGGEQLGDTSVVSVCKVFYVEGAAPNVVE